MLEQYEFPYTTVHNADIRAGGLRRQFDAIILADQSPREIVDGNLGASIRPEYRGGIGDIGVDSLQRFVSEGGTLIALGAASDLVVDRFPVPVRDQKRALRRDQHFAPGTILRIQVDTSNPIGYGMAADTYGFYNNSPFFTLVDGFNATKRVGDRALSERGHRRVGLAARRRRDGGTGGGGRSGYEAGADSCCSACGRSTAPRRTPPSRCCSTRSICRPTRPPTITDDAAMIRDRRHRRHLRQGIQRAERHAVLQGHACAGDARASDGRGSR